MGNYGFKIKNRLNVEVRNADGEWPMTSPSGCVCVCVRSSRNHGQIIPVGIIAYIYTFRKDRILSIFIHYAL